MEDKVRKMQQLKDKEKEELVSTLQNGNLVVVVVLNGVIVVAAVAIVLSGVVLVVLFCCCSYADVDVVAVVLDVMVAYGMMLSSMVSLSLVLLMMVLTLMLNNCRNPSVCYFCLLDYKLLSS